jgi:hypothetical protein
VSFLFGDGGEAAVKRDLAIAGYGCATALLGFGAVTTALPMLSGRWEFPSGGPYWIPASLFGVMACLCGVGLYRALIDQGRPGPPE